MVPLQTDWIEEHNPDALTADGFDAAIIGVAERCGQPALVVYDAELCIQILQKRDGMDYTDAREYFDFNVLGSFVGEHTPLFLWRPPEIMPAVLPAVCPFNKQCALRKRHNRKAHR